MESLRSCRLASAVGLMLLVLSACSAPLPEEEKAAATGPGLQEADSMAPQYHWGDRINFGKGGNSAPYQASGWAGPDPGYTWALGERAIMNLPLEKPAPAGVRMTLRGWPLWAQGKGKTHQTVHVMANGQEVGVWTLDRQGMQEQTFTVPSQATAGGGRLTLVFHFPEATTPKAMGINLDERILSVAFVEMRLEL